MESLFNSCTLLIYLLLFTSICKVPHAPIHQTIPHIQSLEIEKKRKEIVKIEKEKKRKEK